MTRPLRGFQGDPADLRSQSRWHSWMGPEELILDRFLLFNCYNTHKAALILIRSCDLSDYSRVVEDPSQKDRCNSHVTLG